MERRMMGQGRRRDLGTLMGEEAGHGEDSGVLPGEQTGMQEGFKGADKDTGAETQEIK